VFTREKEKSAEFLETIRGGRKYGIKGPLITGEREKGVRRKSFFRGDRTACVKADDVRLLTRQLGKEKMKGRPVCLTGGSSRLKKLCSCKESSSGQLRKRANESRSSPVTLHAKNGALPLGKKAGKRKMGRNLRCDAVGAKWTLGKKQKGER